jgi:hypothetical protein
MKPTSLSASEYIREKLQCDEYWYESMTFDEIIENAKKIEDRRMKEFAGIVSVQSMINASGWSINECYEKYLNK